VSNTRAVSLVNTRMVYSESAFAELVVWQLPRPLPGCTHPFKYRLAYVVDGTCVVRYDNEAGKGDHWHYGRLQASYPFGTPGALIAAFIRSIERWNRENRDARRT